MGARLTQRALVAGATGLVGRELIARLLADARYAQVHVLARRPLAIADPKLSVHVVDFEFLDDARTAFDVDHVFCCLGTTLRQAGSRDAFRRVDYDYVLDLAQRAADAGVAHFVWISVVGAQPRSPAFYSRVKGALEVAIAHLPLRRWTAVRPSLLLGDRVEHRTGESLAAAVFSPVSRFMVGPLRRYRPIHAADVAAAMIAVAHDAPAPAGLEIRSGGRTASSMR